MIIMKYGIIIGSDKIPMDEVWTLSDELALIQGFSKTWFKLTTW